MSQLTIWQETDITKSMRHESYGHKSCVIWLTGLSGSGKSTIANALEKVFFNEGLKTYLLDGDNIRNGINSDLDFSTNGRSENIRRIAEVAKLFVDAGIVVIASSISPIQKDREMARSKFEIDEFIEVHVDCPLGICKERDPKGLYQMVQCGKIKNFTGIHMPYEPPFHPEVHVQTNELSLQESIERILSFTRDKIRI